MATESSSASIRLDALDRQIIALLQPDGRRPFADIATRLGVSEGTIRQRYRRMVDAGILQIVGVADPFKIGFRVMAMIGVNVRIDGGRGIDEIAREITQFPEVSYVVMSTGTFDLFVEVIAQDTEEFTQFLIDRLHAVQGVTHTEAFMLLRMYKLSLGGWRSAEMVKAAGENGDDAPAPRDGRR